MHENEYRLVFEKTGRLKFISHLDLLRTMQRVFARADLPIAFSSGFNPHPLMVFPLPLSVGMESVCEICDLRLTRQVDCEEIKVRVASNLPEQMTVRDFYPATRPLSDIAFAEYRMALDYGTDSRKASEILAGLFSSPAIVVKKTKSGEKEVDISPQIRFCRSEFVEGRVKASIVCSSGADDYLNPTYAVAALSSAAGREPDDVRVVRVRIYDAKGKTFF